MPNITASGNGWTFYDNGELNIHYAGDMPDFDSSDNHPLTPWRDYLYYIRTVTIESGVTSIGDHAFCECASLTSVTIPYGVVSIGLRAFAVCMSLPNAAIPDSVREIKEGAFAQCYALTSVTIPDSVAIIERYAFIYCEHMTSVTIPGSVTEIRGQAFSGCQALANVYYGGTRAQWNAVAIDNTPDYDPNRTNAALYSATVHYGKNEITFDSNGGAGTMNAVTVNTGASYALPGNAFTAPEGKRFKAWGANEAEYEPGESMTICEDVTVSAIWEDEPAPDTPPNPDTSAPVIPRLDRAIKLYRAIPKKPIPLGRRGEHLARRVAFDITQWVTDYGPGTVRLLHQRQGDAAPFFLGIRELGNLGISPRTEHVPRLDFSAVRKNKALFVFCAEDFRDFFHVNAFQRTAF